MYNNRRSSTQSHDRRDNSHEKHYHSTSAPTKKYSKTMILLKSTVFALFIVLVVSIAAFEIVRHNKELQNTIVSKCPEVTKINIAQGIDSVKEDDGVVMVLTKIFDGKQELIRVDPICGKELSRIKFFVNQN
ncbi:MAG: hypothetical protein EXR06_00040 [Rickettsiales bacterium]|nr:hypothetical protein [Rickettsiales bacterium]